MNAEFAGSRTGALFQNSSFGLHSTIASESNPPVFPLTAPGISAIFKLTDASTIKAGIFDGFADDLENNPYNLNWKICQRDGYLIVSEYSASVNILDNLPGTVKIGGYFINSETRTYSNKCKNDYGIYYVVEQAITKRETGVPSVTLFSQFSAAPSVSSFNKLYYSAGFSVSGILSTEFSDELGVAFANALFRNTINRNEAVLELAYKAPLTDKFFIKPDFQYIINPSGCNAQLQNAIVASMQFGFTF